MSEYAALSLKEELGVNTKVVRRAVKNYKLHSIIDKLRADKMNGVMGNV